MELRILGSWGGFPVNGGATSSYLITIPTGNILLDVGSGSATYFSQVASYDTLLAIFLSHWHNDHVADLKTYEHAWRVLLKQDRVKNKLKIFAPKDPGNLLPNLDLETLELCYLDSEWELVIENLYIKAFSVQHTVPAYGFSLQCPQGKLIYTGDTAYFPELINYAQNADVLIADATNVDNSHHSQGSGHMSPQEVSELAMKSDCKQLIYSHLPSDIDSRTLKQSIHRYYSGNFHLANDFHFDEAIAIIN